MSLTSKISSPPHTMNSWYQMVKTLPLSLEDANEVKKAENDSKIAENKTIGELFVALQ